eukprot:1472029-Prymnesium_polylepis.1
MRGELSPYSTSIHSIQAPSWWDPPGLPGPLARLRIGLRSSPRRQSRAPGEALPCSRAPVSDP